MGEKQREPYTLSSNPTLRGSSQTRQTQTLGWLEDSQNNKPQSNSLAAAFAIFASGGMSLAWSLGFSAPHSEIDEEFNGTHIKICWFIAVIIGACLGTAFINILPKNILNLWGSGLVTINGILFITAPGSALAIAFARYFDGIGVGITIIAAIVTGSEQAVKRFRGLVLSTESVGFVVGIMMKTMCIGSWNSDWDVSSNQMQGILALVLGILALLATVFLTIESPVFILRRGEQNEEAALAVLKRLQNYNHDQANELFFECSKLIREDNSRGRAVNLKRSYVPMVKLCLYRAFAGMSFSLPLNWGLFVASTVVIDGDVWWSSTIYGVMRMVGVVVTIFTLDTLGRRQLSAIAMLSGAALLIGVGAVFADSDNLEHESKMQAMIALLTVYQLLSGISAPACTVYLGEAFSISVKPFFILVAVIFENVIQIIICCCFTYTAKSMADYSLALGSLQLVFAVLFVIIMPETKQTTLCQALEQFSRPLNLVYE